MISKMIIEAIEKTAYEDEVDGNCCFCGTKKANGFIERKKMLSGSFTDYNALLDKTAMQVCDYCQKALSDKYMKSPKDNSCGLRLYSYCVDDTGFKTIDMSEKIYYLFEHQFVGKFFLAFSNLGKKHIFFKGKISHSNDEFYVCGEEYNILFNRTQNKELFELVNSMFQLGVTKKELLSFSVDTKKIVKLHIPFEKLVKLKKYRANCCYELIVNALIKDKKKEI